MLHQKFDFKIHNTTFFGQYFEPKTIDAIVILVHGMGEHSTRYVDFVIPKLNENNLAVITYDQFGHGKTQGKRGHNPGYTYLLDTIELIIEKAVNLFGNKPLLLYGHSMGGNLVLNYAIKRKHVLKGVIATSPLLNLAFQPPKWKLLAGRILGKIMPSITLPSELDATAISRDTSEVEKYINDPLVHDKISPNYSISVFDAGNWVIENASKLATPTLVIHGTADQITDYKASEKFVKNNHQKAEIVLFENGYHELHNDLEKEALIATLIEWIQKISKPKKI